MPSRQKLRSEETKQAILAAAGRLFAERGFEAVTMREIAAAANCSHTAIYIYFRDKEALLHQLAMGPLQALWQRMESIVGDTAEPPDDRLRRLARTFIHFCLEHRSLYHVLFMARATRVDVEAPELAVNQLRNQLFGLLRQAIQHCLPLGTSDDLVLAYARILFFTVHGILAIYTDSPEPLAQLLERLAPTFELAVDVMLAGFKAKLEKGANPA